MEQRSEEWFSARRGKVTASAVGGILGLSPYVAREDVMRRMVRDSLGAEPEFAGNTATIWGQNNEDGAILDFRMETGLDVESAPFVVLDDGDQWLGASPDGYVSDGGLIEVKAPFSLRAASKPAPFRSASEQEHYAAQMQVQMYVTGRKHCWFFQWCPADTKLERVERDDEWLNANIPVLKQFWAQYLHELKNNPDEYLAPKRVVIDTPEAAKMIAEWDDLTEQAERVKERRADLLDSIVSMAGGKNALFGGRKLTLTERAGSVAYARVVKEYLPDLDLTKYRGKPSRFWGVR